MMVDPQKGDLEQVFARILSRTTHNRFNENEAAAAAAKKEAAEWLQKLEKSGIHRRYQGCTIDSLFGQRAPLQSADARAAILQYVEDLEKNIKSGRGLILMGPVGTGKTSAAIAVLQYGLQRDYGGMFIGMSSLLDTLFTTKEKSREEWLEFERRLRETTLLVIDDLGTEKPDGWVQIKLDSIINERYNRMKPVVVTTNLDAQGLKHTYSARIIDRLRQTNKVLAFPGPSLRESAK
jgi:DNA replication protein DnaC